MRALLLRSFGFGMATLVVAACGSTVSSTDGATDTPTASDTSTMDTVTSDVAGADTVVRDAIVTNDVPTQNDVAPGSDVVSMAEAAADATGVDVAPPDSNARDVAQDVAPPIDDAGPMCGPQTCGLGLECCVDLSGSAPSFSCQASCTDASVSLSCDGPGNCAGNDPCCAMISLSGGTMIMGQAACTTSRNACMGTISATGVTTRLCHTNADCTGAGSLYTTCCTVANGTETVHGCFSSTLASLLPACIPAQVTCP